MNGQDIIETARRLLAEPLQTRFSLCGLMSKIVIYQFPTKLLLNLFRISPYLKIIPSEMEDEALLRSKFPIWIGDVLYDENRPKPGVDDSYPEWLQAHIQDDVTSQQLDHFLYFGEQILTKWKNRRIVEFNVTKYVHGVILNFLFVFYIFFFVLLGELFLYNNYVLGFELLFVFILSIAGCLLVTKKHLTAS